MSPARSTHLAAPARPNANPLLRDRVIWLCLFGILALGLSFAALQNASNDIRDQRDTLIEQRRRIPTRNISQAQRHLLLLKLRLVQPDSLADPASLRLDADLVQSRINLLRGDVVMGTYSTTMYYQLRQIDTFWENFREKLGNLESQAHSETYKNSLIADLDAADSQFNSFMNQASLHSLAISSQVEGLNERLHQMSWISTVPIVAAVVFAGIIMLRQARAQIASVIETESTRKFPDQDPNPVLRFDAEGRMLYSNPSSQPLQAIFGVQAGQATRPELLAWLRKSFQRGKTLQRESMLDAKVYRLYASPVANEAVANIYGFDVSDLKRAEATVRQQFARLNALRTIDQAIVSNQSRSNILEIVLTETRAQLGVPSAAVLVLGAQPGHVTAQGFAADKLAEVQLSQAQLRKIARQGGLAIPDLRQDDSQFSTQLQAAGFRAWFGAPLTVRGRFSGLLQVLHRRPLQPDAEWRQFLTTLAGQTAIALDNTRLLKDLKDSNRELRHAYGVTLEGWAKALELRDEQTEGHSRRVTEMTMVMVKAMKIPQNEWENIHRGAILHDIGKMGVPDQILHKPGALTPDEWQIMKQHTTYAYELLHPIEFLRPALDIPHAHHEKWDGSGYPRGLAGENIPLAARIFAVIDVWDALRSDRPYRKAWPKRKTLQHIQAQAGSHFDTRVVTVFSQLVAQGSIQ